MCEMKWTHDPEVQSIPERLALSPDTSKRPLGHSKEDLSTVSWGGREAGTKSGVHASFRLTTPAKLMANNESVEGDEVITPYRN